MQAAFECGLCGVPMTPIASAESPIHYHHCPSCGRWCASPYDTDLIRQGTVRAAGDHRARPWDTSFETIKDRLERWLRTVDADSYPDEAPVSRRVSPAVAVAAARPKTSR